MIDEPDPEGGAPDAYAWTVARVTEPFAAFVLSHLNKRGTGTRLFIDPQTFYVLRQDVVAAAETIVTTYDDFRTTNGSTRAWHWTQTDGDPNDAGDYRITSLATGTASDADIAIPISRRLVAFPAGVTHVDLPVSVHYRKFIVRVTVGGRGLDLILDSGASGIELDDDVARSLGLAIIAKHRNSLNAGTFEAGSAIVPKMSVGSLTMTNVRIGTLPTLGDEIPGDYKVVGLLGFDFINDVALALDYEHETATAYDPSSFVPPDDPHTLALAVRLGNQVPLGDVTIDGAIGHRFIYDTGGAAEGMLVFDYFARRNPRAVGTPVAQDDLHLRGAGGSFTIDRFTPKSVTIAGVTLTDLTLYRVKGTSYGTDQDGVIGPQFLQFFTLYLDYANSKLYFVPNTAGRSLLGINP